MNMQFRSDNYSEVSTVNSVLEISTTLDYLQSQSVPTEITTSVGTKVAIVDVFHDAARLGEIYERTRD